MAKPNNLGPSRNRLLIAITLVAAAVLLFSGWMKMRGGVVTVRAEKVIRQSIASVISTNGKIEPVENFEAHAPAAATVKRVLVEEGDSVKAGQLILELDDADARAQVAKALAQLRAAEADVQAVTAGGTKEEILTTRSQLTKAQAERDEARRNLDAIQKLAQNGGASPAEVDAAKNRLQKAEADAQLLEAKLSGRFSSPEVAKVQAAAVQARAAYEAAQEVLKDSIIHAPFAGTVYQLPVKQGSYVQSGALLAQVARLQKMQVRGFVDEPEIGRLAQGQKVEIRWDAIPGRVWEGTLTRVPTVVTMVGTRTVGEVTVAIDNFDRKLIPSVNVNVSILTARRPDALTVSREAVHEAEGKRFVYKVVGNKLETQPVQTGITSLTRVEVTQGLAEDTVVALGAINAQPLRNGMEIKVVER
jgi:HlyD family secretion protein